MSNPEIATAVTEMTSLVVLMNDRDAEFAKSLAAQFEKRGSLSDKQMYWVEKLSHRALNQGDDAPDTAVELGDFAKMVSLFDTASANLKWPKLDFTVRVGDTDHRVVIKRAGPKSKYTGQLMLTDGGPFGDNVYYGRIDTDGVWIPSKSGEEVKDKLVGFLKDFAADPHACVSEYGHKSGNCCFCSKGLTDEKSVTVGYGPVCAHNWGLKEEWKNALKA